MAENIPQNSEVSKPQEKDARSAGYESGMKKLATLVADALSPGSVASSDAKENESGQ